MPPDQVGQHPPRNGVRYRGAVQIGAIQHEPFDLAAIRDRAERPPFGDPRLRHVGHYDGTPPQAEALSLNDPTRGRRPAGRDTALVVYGNASVLEKADIPEDVSVMGFDNWQVLTSGSRPRLTSVDMNLTHLGRQAGLRMLAAHSFATFAKNVIKHRIDRTRPRSKHRPTTSERPGPG